MRAAMHTAATSAGVVLMLAACAEADPPGEAVDEADPSIEVTAPADGEQVEQPFDIEFRVSGVQLGPVEEGLHHLHVYIGDDYEMHFSDQPFTVDGVEEGEHDFRLVLARANHDELDVADTVTLTVTGEPVEDDEDAENDTPGYDY
jgi:hypothetical protein